VSIHRNVFVTSIRTRYDRPRADSLSSLTGFWTRTLVHACLRVSREPDRYDAPDVMRPDEAESSSQISTERQSLLSVYEASNFIAESLDIGRPSRKSFH